MSFQQLPSELLHAILGHLDPKEDRQSLRACALTCRALVLPAHAGIFRALSIHSECGAVAVLEILDSLPHIKPFIKHLHLVETRPLWIQCSKALHKLLSLLSTCAISLDIRQRRLKTEKLRFACTSFTRLQYLEEIFLSEDPHWGFLSSTAGGDTALPTFLNHFPRLQAITLEKCMVENHAIPKGGGVASTVPAPVFRLKKLDVSWCRDTLALDWLTPALSSLQKLRIRFTSGSEGSEYCASFPKFIMVAGQSLRHLEASCYDYAPYEDLQRLMNAVGSYAINLRSLKLVIAGNAPPERPPMQVVVDALLLIGTHKHLQHLTVSIDQWVVRRASGPWEELENLLMEGRFPALRSVDFRLLKSPTARPLLHWPLYVAVPRLVQKNMINIQTISL